MNWIFEHFQIVVLIALGVGSVLKSLWEAKAKANQEGQEEYEPDDAYPSDEDRARPMMPSVPPPLRRHGVPDSPRESGYDEAVAMEAARELKHQRDLADHLRQIKETRATTTGGAAATRARVAAKGTRKPLPKGALSVSSRLRDPAEVRRAFVMREILDPPVSLR